MTEITHTTTLVHLGATTTDLATATQDWVLHHAININIRGNSYQPKDKLKAGLIRIEEPAVNQ